MLDLPLTHSDYLSWLCLILAMAWCPQLLDFNSIFLRRLMFIGDFPFHTGTRKDNLYLVQRTSYHHIVHYYYYYYLPYTILIITSYTRCIKKLHRVPSPFLSWIRLLNHFWRRVRMALVALREEWTEIYLSIFRSRWYYVGILELSLTGYTSRLYHQGILVRYEQMSTIVISISRSL